MFKFSTILADHVMITDADRATTFSGKYNAPLFRTKTAKNEGPPEGFNLRNVLDLNSFCFLVLLSVILAVYKGHLQSWYLTAVCFLFVHWSTLEVYFFNLQPSNLFPSKHKFFGGLSFFVRFVCNHWALKLRLHMVRLSASAAMS